jgi:hypothetical protein
MTFEEIRNRIKALCTLGGWSNADPGPDYAFLANEGLRLFTQRAQHNVEDETFLSVVDQAEYQIAEEEPGWILLHDDATYTTTKRLYKTTEQQIRRENPLWKHAESGTPSRIWLVNQNTVRLYPPPDTNGDAIYFRGVRHEPLLTADTQSPLVSEYYHEAICLLGAWSWGKTHARGEELGVLDRFLSEAEGYTNECKQQHAAADTEVFQRKMRRCTPEYIWL